MERLPNGLDTMIGGDRLSGGERQLVCLARAMLREHTLILAMDESTSNVDVKTESTIRRVKEQFKEKTVVIVSHRVENVDWCDRVVVL